MIRHCLFITFIISGYTGFAQTRINYQEEARRLKNIIREYHVNPVILDDRFSRWIYEDLLDRLDPEKIYFTEADLRQLSSYAPELDDELNGSTWLFLPAVTVLYRKCLQRAENIALQVLTNSFSFQEKEMFLKDTLWAVNEEQLRNRWYLHSKYEVLSLLYEMRYADARGTDDGFVKINESRARLRAKAAMLRPIRRALNHASGFENYVGSRFLESIAAASDPHTNYLSPTAMENFMSLLSNEGYYFGFMLNENNNGDVAIERLTPGGPAWKSGILNRGDIIRELKWTGQEVVDASGVGLDEINDMLLETNHEELEITVAKAGGTRATVRLRKERMQVEDAIVRSLLLEGRKKVGYVYLPGFYSDWGSSEGAKCANDVATEIIKLKNENIEGLILDLRYNGGGSLMEAVAMSGIFIDAGPIGILKSKTGESITLKDVNRGTIFDGPLVVLVNSMSASASEFLAAALQDYQRAIIVGSQTYGKATAQSLFSLDPDNPSFPPASSKISKETGYASVTLQKIYRINGKTAQLKGVTPHISLPDLFDSLQYSEKYQKAPLSSDSVLKKTYYQPLKLLPVKELQYKSSQRVGVHAGFAKVTQMSSVLAKQADHREPVSLRWSDFKLQTELQYNTLHTEIQEPSLNSFRVSHSTFEKQRMQMDPYLEEFNKAWLKKLQTDISLEEGFNIICDYIDITLRKK